MIEKLGKDVLDTINTYGNFPKEGVKFVDILPVLQNNELLNRIISYWKSLCESYKIDAIVAPESRGFLFGSILAYEMDIPFIPIRKSGKLPGKLISTASQSEYSTEVLEMQVLGENFSGKTVCLADDIIATGGTMKSMIELIRSNGLNVPLVLHILSVKGLNELQLEGTVPGTDIKYYTLCEFEE
jgi:adenine phosphoribosyltransferase